MHNINKSSATFYSQYFWQTETVRNTIGSNGEMKSFQTDQPVERKRWKTATDQRAVMRTKSEQPEFQECLKCLFFKGKNN